MSRNWTKTFEIFQRFSLKTFHYVFNFPPQFVLRFIYFQTLSPFACNDISNASSIKSRSSRKHKFQSHNFRSKLVSMTINNVFVLRFHPRKEKTTWRHELKVTNLLVRVKIATKLWVMKETVWSWIRNNKKQLEIMNQKSKTNGKLFFINLVLLKTPIMDFIFVLVTWLKPRIFHDLSIPLPK